MAAEWRGRADWVVVGAGGAGSAAACFLARRGFDTVVLEQFRLNHARGSSHGRTRILRTAYSEGVKYVPLVLRARELWLRLGRSVRRQLFRPTGALVLGPGTGSMFLNARQAATETRLRHRVLGPDDVSAQFPAFRLGPSDLGLWDPGGGVVFPERALKTFSELAGSHGAAFYWNTRVLRWKSARRGVTVETNRGSVEASGVILACGAWTRSMTSSLQLPLAVERQSVFWYRPPEEVADRFRTMPAFVYQRRRRGYYYGTPDLGDGLKVASDVGRPVRDPGRRPRAGGRDERRRVERFLDAYLPQARGRMVRSASCLYTNTPDHDFLVDFHPGGRNVIVVSACSRHGFKFVPALGEAVARMAETGRRTPGWEAFRLDRLVQPPRPRSI